MVFISIFMDAKVSWLSVNYSHSHVDFSVMTCLSFPQNKIGFGNWKFLQIDGKHLHLEKRNKNF
jgi:hypothetical protein